MKLFIRQKIFSFKDRYSVVDENNRPVFQVEGQLFSFGAKIRVYDMQGGELFYIEQKLFRFLPEYMVYQGSNLCARIQKQFSFLKPRLHMESAYGDFDIDGSFWGMDFNISLNNKLMGSIQKSWFTFGDAYEMTIADGADAALFVTLVIAIDHCLHNNNNS